MKNKIHFTNNKKTRRLYASYEKEIAESYLEIQGDS